MSAGLWTVAPRSALCTSHTFPAEEGHGPGAPDHCCPLSCLKQVYPTTPPQPLLRNQQVGGGGQRGDTGGWLLWPPGIPQKGPLSFPSCFWGCWSGASFPTAVQKPSSLLNSPPAPTAQRPPNPHWPVPAPGRRGPALGRAFGLCSGQAPFGDAALVTGRLSQETKQELPAARCPSSPEARVPGWFRSSSARMYRCPLPAAPGLRGHRPTAAGVCADLGLRRGGGSQFLAGTRRGCGHSRHMSIA